MAEAAVMNVFWRGSGLLGVVVVLAGCAVGGLPALGPTASTASVPEAPPPVVYGAFLDGPVGQKLSQGDRDKALAAEQDAVASGQRKPWRGEHGTYGYVEPGAAPLAAAPEANGTPPPASASDSCRGFTSTIYLSGRPQVGHGRGCLNPDGSARVAG